MSDGRIAIVGASCRFPGASNLEAFWDLLISGTDAITEVDERRWSTRFYYHPRAGQPAKAYTWSAGLISEIDLFEPAFFGISPREAAQMDPQQRVLLELVWHALEDAGIHPGTLAGGDTGVYIGGSTTDYRDLRLGDPASGDSYFMTGGTLSILANRISYVFDLHGPSLALDTACSSSLVALHHACEALRDGRIGSAVVGGINLLLSPYPFLGFCRASMLSRRGRCFAFDERADGYVRAEGGGVVVLKPLQQALADGDRIRAVILGTGVNSDGRTIGLSLPSDAAQGALIQEVCARAGIAADDLAFFEMHGTGTPAGDPLEASAVGRALGRSRREPLPIGSVKTNIGHLEPASGMAGLIKAALALDHGTVPATLHCDLPNPQIRFDELGLRLLREPEAIAAGHCAGVNSFGFGGTNGHAVLAAPPRRPEPQASDSSGPMPPLVISARTEASLRDLARQWADVLAAPSERDAALLLRSAAHRREQHPQRLVVLGADHAETAAALADFAAGADAPAVVAGSAVRDGKLAFVFAGNGAQWPGMGRDAYAASPAFRAAVGQADDALQPLLGWSVAEMLERGPTAEELAHADFAQPLLFAIQVGIVTVLRELGIEAEGHIGHSVGEIAAAWGAGALSLPAAARVVAARSHHQERTRGNGRMAALALGAAAARDLIAEIGGPIELGAINATQSVTVSGPADAIERLVAEARRRGIGCRALDLDFAFHSAAMEPIRDELLADLRGFSSVAAKALLVSSVSGDQVTAGQLDADYWWRNIRSPVRFAEGMGALVSSGFRIFVEVGPHPVLQAYLHDALRAGDGQGRVVGTLARKQRSEDPFPRIAGQCHVAGYDITRAAQFDGPTDPSRLPLYPWQKERFWFERTIESLDIINPAFDHPLLGFRQHGPEPVWINHIDPDIVPWLADHAIEGVPVLPAAAVVEMALAAARQRRPDAPAIDVLDIELRRPLPFENGRARELRCLTTEDGDWELNSRPRLTAEPPTLHATARLATAGEYLPTPLFDEVGSLRGEVSAAELYGLTAEFGLNYGPRFRTVSRIELLGTDEALVHLDPSVIGEPLDGYLLHPALMDGALQALLALIIHRKSEMAGSSFLPWRFGRVRLPAPYGRAARTARLRITRVGTRSASADVALFDERDGLVGELSDCWFRRIELTRSANIGDSALRTELIPAPLSDSGVEVLGDIRQIIDPLLGAAAADRASLEEQRLLIEGLLASIALQSVQAVVEPGTAFSSDGLLAAGVLAADAAPLFEAMLELLRRFGIASQTEHGWLIASGSDLPEISEVWRLLLAEAPELVAELASIAATAEELPRLMVDGLCQGESALPPMLEHLLHGSPAAAAGIDLVCGVLGAIAARWPRERPLRVLEIGSDITVTRGILDRLAQSGATLAYAATNPDPEQTGRLAAAVSAVAGAAAHCWSPIEDAPEDFGNGRFDAIIAVHTCARMHIDAAGLARVRELLAPGGLFLAVEPAPNPVWDLVFGRYAEWWRVGRCSPLRSGEAWREALIESGFEDAEFTALAPGPWPNSLFWGRASTVQSAAIPMAAVRSLTMIAPTPGSTAAQSLAAELAALSHRVVAVDADAFVATGPGAEAESSDASGPVLFIVDEAADVVVRAAALMPIFARVARAAAARRTALWVITTGAQQPGTGGLVGAALWGLARVLINEIPGSMLRLVDFAPNMGPAERAAALAGEFAAETAETEIVWSAAGRRVLRVRRGLPARWASPRDALRLGSAIPGGLEALAWETAAPRAPGPGEVAIDVQAAGLNFRDVMWAMGLLPEEALIDGFAGPTFGLECAGIVSAVGPGVQDFKVGDRVAGLAPGALSTHVTTAAHAVTGIPADTSFAAAATIPVTFVTVIYALGTLAQLAPGEIVLIHAAAGGVGLAAIQYAKSRDAIVIATAGSEVKRAFLRLAGADHVLDSRDIGFTDAVRTISGGCGVDVVLNSLSGEAMEQSLGILKPFGRFLELGKRDFYLNRRVHLRPLRQNISYFAIDVDQLPMQRPDLARSLLDEMAAALQAGEIRPLAHRVFPYSAAGDAFRVMQASGHIGKLVLVPNDNAGIRLQPASAASLRQDGTYLVTGGISGFGFAAARWLAQHGAGSIGLLGRRGGETPGAAERIAEIEALGATVCLYSADVADPDSLGAVLDQVRGVGPPLRGVVHAAGAIADGLTPELDESAAAAALRAKLGGAIALDRLTRSDPIELFLLFSSATTLLGAPGQGAYVAANTAVEALARQRRAEGRPALAIAWGPIADAGYLAERPEVREALARRLGAKPIAAAEALRGLPAILDSGLAVAAHAETAWSEARRYLPILATPLFADIRADVAASPSDDSLLERLASLDPEAGIALLKSAIAEEAANILRLPAAAINPSRPLSEMGMDSLMAVELRLALENRLRIDLPLMSLAEGTSVASIATRLANAVLSRAQASEVVSLAQRYELADDRRLAALAHAADRTDPLAVASAAAE